MNLDLNNIDAIIDYYNAIISTVDKTAHNNSERAYGGFIRATKGQMLENIAEALVKIGWKELEAKEARLQINKTKIKIPIQKEYVFNIKDKEIKKYIQDNIQDYYFNCSVDKHIYIDKHFVLGIECKAYTENAMLKRILLDFNLLRTVKPNLHCILFQLESQLTGDYSKLKNKTFGSTSTHTLMSYFDCHLKIITFLKGERKVNTPIHKKEYYKPLLKERLLQIKEQTKTILKTYV